MFNQTVQPQEGPRFSGLGNCTDIRTKNNAESPAVGDTAEDVNIISSISTSLLGSICIDAVAYGESHKPEIF
jgi:hypothetical protein